MTNAIQDLTQLSRRASLRRQRLGMMAKELSAQLGISYTTIKNWEVSLPHKPVPDIERRWEEVLRVPYGWLRDPSIEDDAPIALAMDNTVNLGELELSTVAQEINAVGTWLSRRLETARTFESSNLSPLESRRAGIFATRYGVWGPDRTTLHAIADEHKLTKERIRKIIEPMVQRAVGITFMLPAVEKIRQIAHASDAISVREFNSLHRELLGEKLSFEDADRFARDIAGYSIANQWEKSYTRSPNSVLPLIGSDSAGELAQAVRHASKQMVRNCGAAHVKFVTGMVSQKVTQPITAEAVRNCLNAIEGLQWLSLNSEWYWFGPDSKNLAVDAVRKMLLVANEPMEVEILHEGLCRMRRQTGGDKLDATTDIEIPNYVFDDIIRQIPWVRRYHHNQITLSKTLTVENILTDYEKAVIQTMRELGGECSRNTLIQNIVDKNKMTTSSLQAILGSAPFIRHHASGKYELRGNSKTTDVKGT